MGVIYEDENVLETNKDLSLIAVFSDEPAVQLRKQAESWTEIETLYSLFLKGDLQTLKRAFGN